MFNHLMVVPACAFPEFLLLNFLFSLCSFSALVCCYVCEEATAGGGDEGFSLYDVCVVIVHLRLRWAYSPSKSTLCNPVPEVLHKLSSRDFLLLPVMALEGFHLFC